MRTFVLSSKSARTDWDGSNPLSVLHPHEARAAEMYVLCDRDPATVPTLPSGRKRKWGVLLSGAFGTRFQEKFGIECTSRIRKGLEGNPAWRAYVTMLTDQTRDAILKRLEQDGLEAYEDYIGARGMAKQAGDYKALGLQAADHLDRIGATQKPSVEQHQIVVVLKGRNYDENTLMQELPATTVEVVTVPE